MVQKLDERRGSEYDDDWKQSVGDADDLEDSYNAPSATNDDLPVGHPDRSVTSEALKAAEESGAAPEVMPAAESESDQVGAGYTDTNQKTRRRFLGRFSKRQKIIGGGVIGLVGGTGIIAILFFTPLLRLESYMQRINQRAFAYAASAVEARMGHLFERYMVSHMLNLQSCAQVRSIDCRADYSNQGIASGLFSAWRDVRIEEKLFDRYGITVESTRNNDGSGRHRFRDRAGRLIDLSRDGENFRSAVFRGGSREAGREMRRFLKEETKWYEVMHRRSVRNYLSKKHDMKLWCFFACKTRDNVELRAADAKTRYKYRFVERFVYPFSGKYGFIMNCITSPDTPGSGKCSAEELRKRGIDRDRVPDETINKILADFEDNPNLRLSQVVIKNLLEKIMSPLAARSAVSTIPVAGQIYFAVVVIDMFDRLDGLVDDNVLSQYAADIKASQYLEYYVGMRSMNDEMKSHVISVDEVGAVLSDLEGAEESLVYQAYNKSPTASTSMISSKTYAQSGVSEEDEPYLCDNGQPIAEGEYVCEEKKLTKTYAVEDWRDNRVVDGLVGILNRYGSCINPDPGPVPCATTPRQIIRPILGGIDKIANSIVGPLASAAMAVFEHIPGISAIISFVNEKSQALIEAFFGKVFPLPVDIDGPGREKYDGIEAGADVAAGEFGKGGYTDTGESYGLGAPALADEEASVILQEYFAQQEYEFKNAGLFARLTNLENPNSLASQTILRLPASPERATQNVASGLLGAFSNLGKMFTSLFSSPLSAQTSSQQQLAINAFGITRYGYASNDPAITKNPAELTPQYCEEARVAREASMTVDPVTGFDEYSVADPCLLEQIVVEVAGAAFTND